MNSAAVFKILDVVMVDREKRQGGRFSCLLSQQLN